MAYLIPSIVHRLEQNLIALDACKMLELDIHPDLALEALTKDSENQSEDNGRESMETFEPINFQPGMGNNYVRTFLFLLIFSSIMSWDFSGHTNFAPGG